MKDRIDLQLESMPLDQAIGIAIGAASVCWEHPERAGVFDSEKAEDVAKQLWARFQQAAGVPEPERILHRDASTGQFITEEEAAESPGTSVREVRD